MSLVLDCLKVIVAGSCSLWVAFTVWGTPRGSKEKTPEAIKVEVIEVTRRRVTVRLQGEVPAWLQDAKRDLRGNLVFKAMSPQAACGRLLLGAQCVIIDLEAGVIYPSYRRSRIPGLTWRWGRKT